MEDQKIIPASPYGRILVPLDGSKNAEEILPLEFDEEDLEREFPDAARWATQL